MVLGTTLFLMGEDQATWFGILVKDFTEGSGTGVLEKRVASDDDKCLSIAEFRGQQNAALVSHNDKRVKVVKYTDTPMTVIWDYQLAETTKT